MVKKTF